MKQTNGSILTKSQKKSFGPVKYRDGYIKAQVRHDDECGNGHNSFSITAEIFEPYYQRGEPSIKVDEKTYWLNACGCYHDEVKEAFPELAPFIRWHLSDTSGPMHYEANALYWAGHCGFRDGNPNSPPNLKFLKSTICYGSLDSDASFDLADHVYSDARGFTWNGAKAEALKVWLTSRLERLQAAFRADVEKLGFIW